MIQKTYILIMQPSELCYQVAHIELSVTTYKTVQKKLLSVVLKKNIQLPEPPATIKQNKSSCLLASSSHYSQLPKANNDRQQSEMLRRKLLIQTFVGISSGGCHVRTYSFIHSSIFPFQNLSETRICGGHFAHPINK